MHLRLKTIKRFNLILLFMYLFVVVKYIVIYHVNLPLQVDTITRGSLKSFCASSLKQKKKRAKVYYNPFTNIQTSCQK